jgi:membrane-associated HD superfamily phosphohydrolase
MNATVTRIVALVSTVALAWGVLVYGAQGTVVSFEVGEIAERTYTARNRASVVNVEAYDQARELAAASVEPEVRRNSDAERETLLALDQLFGDVRSSATLETLPQLPSVDPVPSTTTTTSTTAAEGESEPEVEVEPATLRGLVFVDANRDGIFEPIPNVTLSDAPISGIDILARSAGGEVYGATSQTDGTYSVELPPGEYSVGLLMSDIDIPDQVTVTTDRPVQTVTCAEGATCEAAPIGLGAATRPLDVQIAELSATYGVLNLSTIETLVTIANDDVTRVALGLTPALRVIESRTQEEIARRFTLEIRNLDQLRIAQNEVTSSPPIVLVDGAIHEEARTAVGDIVATFLRPNTEVDQIATEAMREEAMEAISQDDFLREYAADQTIILVGEPFDRLAIDAIAATNAADVQPVRLASVAGMLAVLMASLAFYLSRFRRQFWEAPRMVALFCLLIVMAAGAVRLTVELREQSSWFILPAVAFGYLAAVLFDNRMGTLMAIAMGILAATATRNPGLTVFAVLATLAPIGFVSRVSSRRAFRNSVVTSRWRWV